MIGQALPVVRPGAGSARSAVRSERSRRLTSAILLAIASGWSMTSVSAAAPELAARWGASLSEVGVASGALWVTFALAQAPAGRLADRVPTALLGATCLAAMAALNVVALLVPSLWPTILLRIAAGVAGGTLAVVAARSVTALGARGQGIVGGATALGSTLAVACVPALGPTFGWRVPFAGNAVLACAALVLLLAVRLPPAHHGPAAGAGPQAASPDASVTPRLVALSSAIGCSLIAGFALGSWAPTFLGDRSGLDPTAAGIVGAAVVGASIVTRPLGGAIAHRGRFLVVPASLATTAVGALVLALAPGPAVQVVALLVVGFCAGLPFAAVVARAAALVPDAPGRAVGFAGTTGTLTGMAGMALFGYAVDHDLVGAMFGLLAAFAGAAALATVWGASPPGARD